MAGGVGGQRRHDNCMIKFTVPYRVNWDCGSVNLEQAWFRSAHMLRDRNSRQPGQVSSGCDREFHCSSKTRVTLNRTIIIGRGYMYMYSSVVESSTKNVCVICFHSMILRGDSTLGQDQLTLTFESLRSLQ